MASLPKMGPKIRTLRRREGLTQARLAERLEISASYLNLIEHNRRPLPAALLIKLAQLFEIDLKDFASDDDARLEADLMELFGDPIFDTLELTNSEVRELVATSPTIARAVLTLYERYEGAREKAGTLTARMASDESTPSSPDRPGLPSEEVSDLIQRHHNYFAELEDAAEELWRRAPLDATNLLRGLIDALEHHHGVRVQFEHASKMNRSVRRFDPDRKRLHISELLGGPSRHFQIAHTLALLSIPTLLDELSEDVRITTPESRKLARIALANYFAGAVLMPYVPFLEAARRERYDIDLLAHRFGVSFEQVCHRLTCLRRPGAEGVPFHLIRIDLAGNISKKFSATSMRFPRFSGLCPKWNVFAVLLAPDAIRVQLSRVSESTAFFSVAKTLQKGQRGYHASQIVHAIELGCDLKHARELVYADGIDLENDDATVHVGMTCRLCRRMDCEQRTMPSIYAPLQVDETVRALSLYQSVEPSRGRDGD